MSDLRWAVEPAGCHVVPHLGGAGKSVAKRDGSGDGERADMRKGDLAQDINVITANYVLPWLPDVPYPRLVCSREPGHGK